MLNVNGAVGTEVMEGYGARRWLIWRKMVAAVLSHSDFTLQRIFGSVELFALLQLLARGRRCSANNHLMGRGQGCC